MSGMIEKMIDEYGLNFLEEESVVQLEGLDDCICGIVERFGMDSVLLYDRNSMIEKMISQDGMEYEEAIEFFDFNIKGAWMGEGTPCFFTDSYL